MTGTARRPPLLADPALHAALARYVRTRVPESEVDDIVQSTIADALASTSAPANDAEVRPWLFGIARNKVVDFFRRTRRELPKDGVDAEELADADSAPVSARDLLRWAEREVPPDARGTLDWMLREAHGEKLETIAREANVPAPRVRQKVTRLRKHLRARWAVELAALTALVTAAIVVYLLTRTKNDVALPEPLPAPSALPSALPAVSTPEPPPIVPAADASAPPPDAQKTAPKIVPKKAAPAPKTKKSAPPVSTDSSLDPTPNPTLPQQMQKSPMRKK